MPSNTDPSSASGFATNLRRFSNVVDKGISRAFRIWAGYVSRKPYTVIAATAIFGLVWTVAFFFQLTLELDNDDLLTPNDAESFDAKDYVDALYHSYAGRARILSIRHPNAITEDGCEGRLLLKNETVARENIQELYRVYEELLAFEVEYDDAWYNITDICIRPSNGSTCLLTSILDLWEYDANEINRPDFNPLTKIDADEQLLDRFGVPLNVQYYLGRPETDSPCQQGSERSKNVESLAMTLIYVDEREEVNGAEIDPESRKYVEELTDYLKEVSKTMTLDAYLADVRAIGKASDELIQDDLALLTIGYILIILYTHVVLFRNSCLACKAHLSIVSVVAIGLALMTAFGMAQTFGVKFNMVIQILPFLILGLGIDDTFVIIGAYQRVPFDLPVPEKIAQTLERAGSSIFVTSATDFCAFLMGLYTRLPALYQFSVHAASAILFDFAFQVTFFVAFLVLDARREARYRNGSPSYGLKSCCADSPYDEDKIINAAPGDQEMKATSSLDAENGQQKTDNHASVNPDAWKKMCGEGDYKPEIPRFSTKLAGTYIPSVTLHPIGRIVVIAIECFLLGLAIHGCTKVKMNFNYVDMITPNSSPLKTAFDLEDQYYNGDQLLFSVYTKEAATGDYFNHQDELERIRMGLDDDPYVVGPIHTWYERYIAWLRTNSTHVDQLTDDDLPPDSESFHKWLREFLRGPGAVFENFVIFSNGSNSRIISSKIDAVTVDIEDGRQSIDLLDSIRDTVEEAAPSLNPVPFAMAFLFFDGYRVIAWETIRNVLMAGVGVFIMNVVVLASIPMAGIVVGMVALTDAMLFGYMWYADQYFNPVTAISLVLAVGIAVDYSAHIAHSFLVLSGDRLSRARGALEHIGGEVISGAFTTFLGIVVMGFAEHYFFQSFFKMFLAIVVGGAWHGIIFLPVVLSFIGSDPYLSRTDGQRVSCPVAASN